MKQKQYILAIGETDCNNLYSIIVTKAKIVLGIVIFFAFCFVSSFFALNGLNRIKNHLQLDALIRENQLLKDRFASWNEKTTNIETGLQELQKRNQQIRATAALSSPENELGVGGPQPFARTYLMEFQEINQIELNLDRFESEITRLRQSTKELEEAVSSRILQIAHYPSIRPIREGWISSSFGNRFDPFTGKIENHPGIDISVKPETEILAPGAGIVKAINTQTIPNKGYGKYIIIDHGFGYETLYGHLSEVFVTKGQHVKRWDLIGMTGCTGKSTAPHLHYGVFSRGIANDPVNFILE